MDTTKIGLRVFHSLNIPQVYGDIKELIAPLSAYNSDNRSFTINFVTADAYLKETWDNLTSILPLSCKTKFDSMISNPPYGKLPASDKAKNKDHLKYLGERELMAVELCNKYAKYGNFIMPPGSCDVQFSGRPFFDRRPSRKLDALRKALGKDIFFQMEIDGIDTSIYQFEWKNTSILTERISINMNRSNYE